MAASETPVAFETVIDYRKQITARRDRVRFIDIPPCRHFAIDGSGRPGDEAFQAAIGALYPVAYIVHFVLKRRGVDAPVGALEGLFWSDEGETMSPALFAAGLDQRWSLGLPLPDTTTEDEVAAAIADVALKKDPPALAKLYIADRSEGPSAQILHVGPYAAEAPTIERLHAAISSAGLRPCGRHHEIYISDPNRTASEKLKTIIRQPVEPS